MRASLVLAVALMAGCARDAAPPPSVAAALARREATPPAALAESDANWAAALDPEFTDRIGGAGRPARHDAATQTSREREYCQDYANQIATRSASASELLATQIVGYSSRERRIFNDCMSSFARINRFMAR